MTFMPFALDRSATAKLIKSIDSNDRNPGDLEQLHQILVNDILMMPYSYLEQSCRRTQSMLHSARNDAERALLESIYMMAFRRIQRIHMESRP